MLQSLERVAYAAISPKFWKRYVDDTFVVIKQDKLSTFHQLLNTALPEIGFTMETAAENKLPFLDVLVHKLPSGTFEASVYTKATNADIVLHYDSNSPASHKRSCVTTLFSRITTHCVNAEARNQERNYLHLLYDSNGYPLNFIKRALRHQNSQPPPNTDTETVHPT